MTVSLEGLRYPIGRFEPPPEVTAAHVEGWIDDIERLPGDLRRVVEPLSSEQLETRYRPGGWTLRQVVHHLTESHLNSYIRFKWALTEERSRIKAYDEERWAELADVAAVPVGVSLDLLDALHRRWVGLLRTLSSQQLKREFVHPESGVVRLDVNVGIYAWHGRHHLAHIEGVARRLGW